MTRKILISFSTILLVAINGSAQIGIATNTPNSSLDVSGSYAAVVNVFSASTAAAITDNTFVFTGTSAATLTLPDATSCVGRQYWIKNTSSNASVLTIATTSSQTIEGLSAWTLTQINKVLRLLSDGSNWLIVSESLPGTSSGTAWVNGGNAVGSIQKIGATSNFDFPFITGTTEKMRLTATGDLGIGTTTFNSTYPEQLVVDAGVTGSVNAIVGKGNINNYLQLNIQNRSGNAVASSDVVATADNGNEITNYIDLGINGSGYSSTGILGGNDNAYLYATGNDFVIGNSTDDKSLIFYTTTAGTNIERMRINAAGLIPGQDNAYSFGTSGKRWTAVWAANGTIQTSDSRLKKNIQQLSYGLSDVMKLTPVSYDWKDNTGYNKVGLIAQEVEKIIPQVVTGNEKIENLGMNYAELVPVLINAIKDLKQEINEMKKTIDELNKSKK
jgi:hypothetical protein